MRRDGFRDTFRRLRLWPECTGKLSACLGDRKATFQGQRSAPARPSAAIGGASVIRPGAYLTYDAFPFSPLFGYPAVNLGFPQPLGHQIISYGAGGYIYRPVTNLAAYYDRAVAALRTANYNQVLVELDPVLSETPEDGDTWMVRAQALFALGTYGKAASSLHTALRLLPNAEWGRPVVRVRDYFASEAEFAVRLRALETYVRDHPREGAGHFLLGYYYGYRGNTSLAERELRTALRLVTGDEELANALLAPLQAAPLAPAQDKPRPGLDEDDGPRRILIARLGHHQRFLNADAHEQALAFLTAALEIRPAPSLTLPTYAVS